MGGGSTENTELDVGRVGKAAEVCWGAWVDGDQAWVGGGEEPIFRFWF